MIAILPPNRRNWQIISNLILLLLDKLVLQCRLVALVRGWLGYGYDYEKDRAGAGLLSSLEGNIDHTLTFSGALFSLKYPCYIMFETHSSNCKLKFPFIVGVMR